MATSPSLPSYNYPFAAAPDIIRSNQKDTALQASLQAQLTTILRSLYGSRFTHTHTPLLETSTSLLYHALTTLLGNRTLGEEYTDMIQIDAATLSLPPFTQRLSYILSTILLPYTLSKFLPSLRARIRKSLETSLQKPNHNAQQQHQKQPQTLTYTLQSYLLQNLTTLTSPSPLYALSLAIFYFTGSYYHLSKRIFRLRYIFTKRLDPSDQRVGYEVLGVLLVLQMAVQSWIHMHDTLGSRAPVLANVGNLAGGSAVVGGGVEIGLGANVDGGGNELIFEESAAREGGSGRIAEVTNTPILHEKARYNLQDDNLMGWIQGRQQRKCTLCLEELKDPSATTCGHVFCWTCIADWIKEKAECPLCRQAILAQHVLPLRG
ncbi:peroxisome biogenesis factor 10 [Toensbergia leucococca]|nr:peroxisome biogenesis factor 10 [Toensbergia leucococca]